MQPEQKNNTYLTQKNSTCEHDSIIKDFYRGCLCINKRLETMLVHSF
jgi:hypothetical protein